VAGVELCERSIYPMKAWPDFDQPRGIRSRWATVVLCDAPPGNYKEKHTEQGADPSKAGPWHASEPSFEIAGVIHQDRGLVRARRTGPPPSGLARQAIAGSFTAHRAGQCIKRMSKGAPRTISPLRADAWSPVRQDVKILVEISDRSVFRDNQ